MLVTESMIKPVIFTLKESFKSSLLGRGVEVREVPIYCFFIEFIQLSEPRTLGYDTITLYYAFERKLRLYYIKHFIKNVAHIYIRKLRLCYLLYKKNPLYSVTHAYIVDTHPALSYRSTWVMRLPSCFA